MHLLKEFKLFLAERKRFWMIPIIILVVTIGALLVLNEGSAATPFVYTVF
jgi:hypothetical protein